MTIIRRQHNSRFTIVPNAVFEDRRLSVEAKGTLGYLLSRPHNWNIHLRHVARFLGVGRDKMQRIFKELIGAGYVSRHQVRADATQKWEGIEYVVYDVPQTVAVSPQPELPRTAEPQNLIVTPRTSPVSEPIISPEASALAGEIAVIAGYELDKVPPQWCGAALHVGRCLREGWPREVILAGVRCCMAKKQDGPPFSVRYFEQEISRQFARMKSPLPLGMNMESIDGADRQQGQFTLVRPVRHPRREKQS
jgi:hypothetical protein